MTLNCFTKPGFHTGIFLRWAFVVLIALCADPHIVTAQDGESGGDSSSTSSPSPTPAPTPTPIPLTALVTEAELTSVKLAAIRTSLEDGKTNQEIKDQIPSLADTVSSHSGETTNLLAGRPSLDDLTTYEREWQAIARTINGWKDDLKAQASVLDKQIAELVKLKSLWQRSIGLLDGAAVADQNQANSNPAKTNRSNSTLENSNQVGVNQESLVSVPPEVMSRAAEIIVSIGSVQKLAETRRAEILTIQSRISEIETQVATATASIKERRSVALTSLFVRDAPAIWQLKWKEITSGDLISKTRELYSQRAVELRDYADANVGSFVTHGVILLLFILGLYWARKRIDPFVEREPKLERAVTVFRLPFATALVLTILLSGWLYPQAPKLLSNILGAAALVPVVILLRRIVDRPLFLILYALVIFYFVDRAREVMTALTLVVRLVFIAEILGAVVFLVWFMRSKKLSTKVESRHFRFFETIKKIIPVALVIFAAALLANLLGFVSLSYLIGNGILRTAYLALVLYTAVEILKSLFIFALRVRPLSSLRMVKAHRHLILVRFTRAIQSLAVIFWLFITLSLFSVSDAVYSFLSGLFFAEAKIGSISISLSDIIFFAGAIWISFLVSRFVRFVLQEDIYPRINIGSGISYAISTMVHYVLLVVGFMVAIAAFGIDLSKFAILAGAVGVGLGFGLQNVINNFVSGLILLFERPVKVGDMVQIGAYQGNLTQIGLRASVLRQFDGSDVIVPNSHLISEEVINWTKSDTKRRIEIPIGVAYGSDADQVIELLTSLLTGRPDIMIDPAPVTLFRGLGDSTLDFELRAWTENSDRWLALQSEIITDVYAALNAANIEIPFPQRDLHLRSSDVRLVQGLNDKKNE